MKNGKGNGKNGNGYDDPKVMQLAEARRRAAMRGTGKPPAPARTVRDVVIGSVFVAMALGMIAFAGLRAWEWFSAMGR